MLFLVVLILVVMTACSILMRIKIYRQINNSEVKASLLSVAIQDLVAIAGGIYLALIMLISFLRLDIPDRILLCEIFVDPLALTAIVLSIVQPMFFKIYNTIKACLKKHAT